MLPLSAEVRFAPRPQKEAERKPTTFLGPMLTHAPSARALPLACGSPGGALLFFVFFGGVLAGIGYGKKGYPYSNLSTGGPSHVCQKVGMRFNGQAFVGWPGCQRARSSLAAISLRFVVPSTLLSQTLVVLGGSQSESGHSFLLAEAEQAFTSICFCVIRK